MVGPNYTPPENTIPDVWSFQSETESIDTPLIAWWESLNDAQLSRYIEQAAENNYDLLTAESNILQARAMRQITASSFYPQIGADVNATRTYFSKNGPVFAIGPSTGSAPGTVSQSTGLPFNVQAPQTQNLYNALFDAIWEIDLFGKIRRSVEAADALIGSAIENRNDVLITVLAEVARNYVDVRGNQSLQALISQNIELLEKKKVIVEKQFACGYVSQIDYQNLLSQLAEEKSLLPDLDAQIHRGIYTLSILTGALPEALLDEMKGPQPLPQTPMQVAVGIRSDLLRRRPDIRLAERNLAAATANVGVAVASFFPTITLFGDGGLQSLMLNNLFTLGSRTWAFGGDATMPIFEGGKIVGQLHLSQAAQAAQAATYQQTVLSALQETESALIAYTQQLDTTQFLLESETANANLVQLSDSRHQAGLINLINVLDTKRQLNEVQQSVVRSQLLSLTNLITLYKALGGGWQTEES